VAHEMQSQSTEEKEQLLRSKLMPLFHKEQRIQLSKYSGFQNPDEMPDVADYMKTAQALLQPTPPKHAKGGTPNPIKMLPRLCPRNDRFRIVLLVDEESCSHCRPEFDASLPCPIFGVFKNQTGSPRLSN